MQKAGSKIILAGSGMSTGGRVLMHEREVLADPRSTICIVGYQAAGSLGRRLLDGEKKVSVMGSSVPVLARIERIFSYSAHMDSSELLEFAGHGKGTLEEVFVVMGEPAASAFLAQRMRDYSGLPARVPRLAQSVAVDI